MGNAVGALVGKGIKRVELLIKTKVVSRSPEEKTEDKEKPVDESTHESCIIEGALKYDRKTRIYCVFPVRQEEI